MLLCSTCCVVCCRDNLEPHVLLAHAGLTKPTRKSALEHVLVAKAALLLASAGVVALLSVLSFHGWKPLGNLSV